jgi:hypothetical protein
VRRPESLGYFDKMKQFFSEQIFRKSMDDDSAATTSATTTTTTTAAPRPEKSLSQLDRALQVRCCLKKFRMCF